jgi:hypothetical protein
MRAPGDEARWSSLTLTARLSPKIKRSSMLESGFFSPSAAERAAERIIGDGQNRFVIEDALEFVPPQHLEALLAHDDFCILLMPRIPHLGVDSMRREARIEYPSGLCCGRRVSLSDESQNPVSTLLHEIGHALDNTCRRQLSQTFGARLLRIFENLAVESGAHFRTDDECFAEAYALALSPSGCHRFFHMDVPRDLKQLLAGVLQEIRTVRL